MIPNDPKLPQNYKLKNYNFMYVYQMKASIPGNLKTDIEYIFDHLVTSNNL